MALTQRGSLILRERFRTALTQPHWQEKYQNKPTGRILASPDDLLTDLMYEVNKFIDEAIPTDVMILVNKHIDER